MSGPITREEFVKCYSEEIGANWDDLKDRVTPVKCDCGFKFCPGWVMAVVNRGLIGRYDGN